MNNDMEVIDLTQPEIVDLTGDDEEKEEEKEEILSDLTDAYDECCVCYDYDYVFWHACNVCVAICMVQSMTVMLKCIREFIVALFVEPNLIKKLIFYICFLILIIKRAKQSYNQEQNERKQII
jgi:hypothetical protein